MRKIGMWGFGISFIGIMDRISGRKDPGGQCDVCNKVFQTFEQKEEHRRLTHPDKELLP